MRRKLEVGLAAFSILAAVVHFAGEMAFHVRLGQFLPELWVSLVADALLLVASLRVLNGPGAIAPLCGAWGFTSCLSWILFNGLFLRMLEGRASPDAATTIPLAAGALLTSAIAFALSLGLSWRRADAGS